MIQSKLVYLESKVKELQRELQRHHSEFNMTKILFASVLPVVTGAKSQEYSKKVEELEKFVRMVDVYLNDFKQLTDEGLDVRNESYMRMTKNLRMMKNLGERMKDIYGRFVNKNAGRDSFSYKECRKQMEEYTVHYTILKREEQSFSKTQKENLM